MMHEDKLTATQRIRLEAFVQARAVATSQEELALDILCKRAKTIENFIRNGKIT